MFIVYVLSGDLVFVVGAYEEESKESASFAGCKMGAKNKIDPNGGRIACIPQIEIPAQVRREAERGT